MAFNRPSQENVRGRTPSRGNVSIVYTPVGANKRLTPRLYIKNSLADEWLGSAPERPLELCLFIGVGVDAGKLRFRPSSPGEIADVTLRRNGSKTEGAIQSLRLPHPPNGLEISSRLACEYQVTHEFLEVTLPWLAEQEDQIEL